MYFVSFSVMCLFQFYKLLVHSNSQRDTFGMMVKGNHGIKQSNNKDRTNIVHLEIKTSGSSLRQIQTAVWQELNVYLALRLKLYPNKTPIITEDTG